MEGSLDPRTVVIVHGKETGLPFEMSPTAEGYELEAVPAAEQVIDRLRRREWPRLILFDLEGPESLEELRQMAAHDGKVPIVVTAEASESTLLLEALRCGAHNCLVRPVRRQDLEALLASGKKDAGAACCYNDRLTDDLWFVASSPAMRKIRQQVAQIAPADVPVFINGESGVGKEVIARMIHQLSARSGKAFVKVNCAALPGELLESELFGYEQGAFTGAVRAKPGKFESAGRGTIFLDEIAEMAPHLQAKLLHVLQDNQFSRLGGRVTIETNTRVLAATNTPVQEAIRNGHFRKDLYYRLSVFSLTVPPLRERRNEIPLLFRHFISKYNSKYSRVAPDPPDYLVSAAIRYDWPGNLRELENLVKRYVILGDAEEAFRELVELTRCERRTRLDESPGADRRGLKQRVRDLKDDTELEAILGALEAARWCRKQAARQLGISYKALLNKMHRLHLDGGPGSRAAARAAAQAAPPGGNGHGHTIWEAKQR